MTDLQTFQSAMDSPWYEIHFEISRWTCPAGLQAELLEDVIEALQPIDHVLFTALETVNRYTHGLPDEPHRYLPEALLEPLNVEMEGLREQFEFCKSEMEIHWQQWVTARASLLANLTPEQQSAMAHPAASYRMTCTETCVELPESTRHLLEGTYNPPPILVPESHQGMPWPDFESPNLPPRVNQGSTPASLAW